YLRPDIAVRLFFHPNGTPRTTIPGRRVVMRLADSEMALHLKFCPQFPGVEEAVQVLGQQLFEHSLAPSELFRFVTQQGVAYPVLISQHVPKGGPTDAAGNVQALFNQRKTQPQKINRYFDQVDAHAFSELLLLTLLTNPKDANPKKFVLQPFI